MEIPDRDLAERCLRHIGFHRLRAYWSPFEAAAAPGSGRRFVDGASFHLVMSRYMFDQRLRSLLMEAFSYIEVSVRTQWAYQLVNGFGHGEFAHRNASLFNPKRYAGNWRELQRNYQVARNGSHDFGSCTIWDLLPMMSFGQLSKWYASLNDRAIGQAIAQTYGMDEFILRPTLHHLSKIRNICAHHERLWDLTISRGFRIPRTLGGCAENAAAFNAATPYKVYNTLVMTACLMEVITPNGDWTERFLDLRETDAAYNSIRDDDMGFPAGWRGFALWRQRNAPDAPAES